MYQKLTSNGMASTTTHTPNSHKLDYLLWVNDEVIIILLLLKDIVRILICLRPNLTYLSTYNALNYLTSHVGFGEMLSICHCDNHIKIYQEIPMKMMK